MWGGMVCTLYCIRVREELCEVGCLSTAGSRDWTWLLWLTWQILLLSHLCSQLRNFYYQISSWGRSRFFFKIQPMDRKSAILNPTRIVFYFRAYFRILIVTEGKFLSCVHPVSLQSIALFGRYWCHSVDYRRAHRDTLHRSFIHTS